MFGDTLGKHHVGHNVDDDKTVDTTSHADGHMNSSIGVLGRSFRPS
jgi:hypothetical protein